MPVSALPFPDFDPVLISIGPLAIRWYALAYIFGILLGLALCPHADPQCRSVGRQGADDRSRISTITSSGSRSASSSAAGIGYVLFYNPAHFAAHPAEIVQLWSGGMSFHGGFAGCVAAVMLFARSARHLDPVARRSHLCRRSDRNFPRAAREFHQRRIVGPAGRRALGFRVSRCRARCRVIRASFTRRRWRDCCCSSCWRSRCARAR